MSLVDEKIALLNEIEAELLRNIDFLNLKVLQAVNKKLLAFEISGGKFSSDKDAPVVVAQLKKEIRDIIEGEEYQSKFDRWLKNYDEITNINIKIQGKVNKLNLLRSEFIDVKKAAIKDVVAQLIYEGVDANFINPLTQSLMRNVLLGATVSDTQSFLETYITGDDETAGKLTRYAGQLARDSVSQFDGQLNQQIMNDYEMDGFAYVGSIVDDSRPFCVHVIEDMDGFIPEAELERLLESFLNSPTKSRGMIDNTTPETFAVYRGGWNCRHAAIPVFKDTLKKVAHE